MTLDGDGWEAVFGIEAVLRGGSRRCPTPTVPPVGAVAVTGYRQPWVGFSAPLTLWTPPLFPGPQEREHRQDAAVILVRGAQLELLEDARDVLLDRAGGHDHPVCDGLVGASFGHQLE